MSKVVDISEMLGKRWRQNCLQELSRNWRMPLEEVLDTLLLEAYLQMVRDKALPLAKEQTCDHNEER
ncbi:hypothetical protein AB4090_14495 [Acidithiobacillus sp. IBUN Pt1247-S3]|uniref:hypothetical protein n=1 Tax=Acidithiobacillus sp. IBUN Pt1247-S3 TaxID=3166642 RepID=UPI0034E5822A